MRIRPSNPCGRFNTIQSRHVDVHYHHRGLQLYHRPHGLFAITRLADNVAMEIGGEESPERLPNLRHVIDEQDSDDLSAFAFHIAPPFLKRPDASRLATQKESSVYGIVRVA